MNGNIFGSIIWTTAGDRVTLKGQGGDPNTLRAVAVDDLTKLTKTRKLTPVSSTKQGKI